MATSQPLSPQPLLLLSLLLLLLLLLLLAAIAPSSAAATARMAHFDAEWADAQRGGHKSAASVYFDAAAPTNRSTPLVIVSHGLLGDYSGLEYMAQPFVDAGFVLALMNDYNGADVSTPYHYALSLAFLRQQLAHREPRLGSIGKASAVAVGGHSEGGAGTFVTLNDTRTLAGYHYDGAWAAGFGMSGCLQGDMTYVEACVRHVRAPLLLLAGELDCLCGAALERSLYAMAPAPCKLYVELRNGTHCGYMKAPPVPTATCELADAGCHLFDHVLPAERQRALTLRIAIAWLRFALGGATAQQRAALAKTLGDELAHGTVRVNSTCVSP